MQIQILVILTCFTCEYGFFSFYRTQFITCNSISTGLSIVCTSTSNNLTELTNDHGLTDLFCVFWCMITTITYIISLGKTTCMFFSVALGCRMHTARTVRFYNKISCSNTVATIFPTYLWARWLTGVLNDSIVSTWSIITLVSAGPT